MRFLLPFLLFASVVSAADKPLKEAALAAAKDLKAGTIVTAESIDGKVTFSAAPSPSEKDQTYSENTLFEIGSITKVFTGLLLAQAVVEGKVTLDTPISKLLDPKLTFADPRIAAITLVQLSTHTSGLPRLPANHILGVRGDDPYSAYDEKMMADFLTSAKLKGDAPYLHSYSNLGVGLLGHLLGKVYQMSWEDAVVSKICEPLGLHDTRMTVTTSKLPLAPPHDGAKPTVSWHFDAVAGAGALRSTAADLLKFGLAMARPEATPLAQAFALAMQPHAEASSRNSTIGLGPFIEKRDGITSWSHGGGTGGYRSALQVIPEQKIVRVVLINNTSLEGDSVIARTRTAPPRVMPKEVKIDPQILAEYPGVYTLDNDSRFTLLVHQDQLWTRLTGQAFLPLYAKDKDQFFLKVVNAEVHFTRQDGKVTALTLFQNGRELTAKRTDPSPPKVILHKAEELKPYTGTYFLLGLKQLTLTTRGSTLYAQMAGQEAAPVFDTGKDRFEFDVVEAALIFNRDDKGAITGLVLSQNGANIPAGKKKE